MKIITPVQVQGFLQARLGGDIQEVAVIGKGDWSQAFSFQRGSEHFVVRFGAHVEDFNKDRRAMRFATPSLPIPRVLEIGEALGGYFCLSERAWGTGYLEEQGAEEMRRSVPAVCQLLDALRGADVSGTVGFGGWSGTDGNAPFASWPEQLLAVDQENERVHGWHASLAESPTGVAPYREALAYLQSQLDICPSERHLIHNDLLHFNVLVSGDKISAVVDWGNSLYGDFLYDLAAFTFYAPWYPAMQGVDWERELHGHWDAQGVALPLFTERLRCYQAHIGLEGMAYSAFTRRWGDLADTARRTLFLLRA